VKGQVVFGIEGWKLAIIVIAALFLVPSDKIPEIARTIGKFVKMFNQAREDMEKTIKSDMFSSVGDTAKTFTDTGDSLASTLYGKSVPEDDEEEGEEE
jgi:Sec-independent protein translocase protein TatA